jgi:COX assembly protein 2
MHPQLDRPHPDCEDVVNELKECHLTGWNKWTGACNDIKFRLDRCFKAEKARLLEIRSKALEKDRAFLDKVMQENLGHELSFEEYLAQDKGFQKAMKAKEAKQQNL